MRSTSTARTGRVEATFVILDGDELSPDLSTDRYAVFPILDKPGSYRYLDLETGSLGDANVRFDASP